MRARLNTLFNSRYFRNRIAGRAGQICSPSRERRSIATLYLRYVLSVTTESNEKEEKKKEDKLSTISQFER